MSKDLHFRIICIRTDSGLPLFVRSIGSPDQLPDPVVTSLNGIYTFCSSYGVKLIKTIAGDVCISWKTFYKSLTLIIVTNASLEEQFHENILNLIFNSFILLLGFEELQQNISFDKLKRNLQVCYRLIDSIVDVHDHQLLSCVLTQTISSLFSPDLSTLQTHFDEYVKKIGASLACIFISGLLSAATVKMKQLTAIELVLLQRLAHSILSSTSSSIVETVIFLPESTPNKAMRLILLRVIYGGTICLLCGETPRLSEIVPKTQQYWSSRGDDQSRVNLSLGNLSLIVDLSKMVNKSLPYMKDINKDIVSFLLVNKSLNQNLLCTDVNQLDNNPKKEKGKILKVFYMATQRFFSKMSPIRNTGQDYVQENFWTNC